MTEKSVTNVFGRNLAQYKQGKRIIVNQGGSRCFDGDQIIVSESGLKEIKNIKAGESVLTPNGLRKVLEVHKMKNSKPCYLIKLKNGKVIKCTEDHHFYFKGEWISIKHILSLWNERHKKL